MTGGKKFDQGKPSVTLIPSEAILGTANALTYGAKKYGRHNYREGIAFSRLVDAAMRHLLAFIDGEDVDVESGNPHVDHAMASLAMLAYMIKNKPELDDRYKPKLKEKDCCGGQRHDTNKS